MIDLLLSLAGAAALAFTVVGGIAALARLRRGEPADTVLDDRFIAAFAIAGTAEDSLVQAAQYRRAGVAELVLTFGGPQPEADMAHFATVLSDRRGTA